METEQSIHQACLQVKKAYITKRRAVFAKHQLSPAQPHVLRFLKFNEGCSQKELAEHCLIEQATATSLLAALENQGLIVRKPSLTDKRKLALYLTPLGHEKTDLVIVLFEELEALSEDGFTEAERAQFISYLNRLLANLVK